MSEPQQVFVLACIIDPMKFSGGLRKFLYSRAEHTHSLTHMRSLVLLMTVLEIFTKVGLHGARTIGLMVIEFTSPH